MSSLVTSIVMLIISLGIVILLREKIRESDFLIKIGVFSIIVSILGKILSYFVTIGFLIHSIFVAVTIMSLIMKVYIMIFKKIERATIKWGLFSLFLFIIFSVIMSENNFLILGNKFFNIIYFIRILSVICILICVLIEVYKIIFDKEKDKLRYEEENTLD